MALASFRFSIHPRAMAVAITGIALLSFASFAQEHHEQENEYNQVNLVSNGYVQAKVIDKNLVNPWGMIASPTSPVWISNQGTNTSTVYTVTGVDQGKTVPLIVSIPTVSGGPNGPTGIVFNTDLAKSGFGIPATAGMVPSIFIFGDLNGNIYGWNPGSTGGTTDAVLAVDNHAKGAAYTGLALAPIYSNVYLYAANFSPKGGVEVFDSSFKPATNLESHPFVDWDLPHLPPSQVWAPYNVAYIHYHIYVAYAALPAIGGLPIRQPGLGVVAEFTTRGKFVRNVVEKGRLNVPWGLAVAPAHFGRFSNMLLVGNFGDGRINAFRLDADTEKNEDNDYAGTLRGPDHKPLENGALWTLWFGNGANGADANTLYITTGGPNEFADGLFAAITPSE